MSTKGIKKTVGEFNSLYFGNYARIFFNEIKDEVYMIEYVDQASGPASLPEGTHEIAHRARREGKITMQFIRNCIDEQVWIN